MTAWERLPLEYRAQLERNAKNIPIARRKIEEWHAAHPNARTKRGVVEGCPMPETSWRPAA